jgi:hypothetical protein
MIHSSYGWLSFFSNHLFSLFISQSRIAKGGAFSNASTSKAFLAIDIADVLLINEELIHQCTIERNPV